MRRLKPILMSLIILTGISLLFSCGDLPDITKGTSSSVDQRFQDSTEGKAKPLLLPRVKDPEHFNFLWLTDMHIRPDRNDYFDLLGNYSREAKSSFIITSGDLTDSGEEEDYDHVLYQVSRYLNVPFYSAIGNHDLYGDGWDEFKKKIGPSVAVFKYGNTMFMLIDTASCEVGLDQMDWIEDHLKEYKNKVQHKVIFSHMCLYNDIPGIEFPIILCDPEERLRLLSLLKEYKVEYFLCGHGHYEDIKEIHGTTHIQGATASAWNTPVNKDPEFFVFTIDGETISYEKKYFKDLEY